MATPTPADAFRNMTETLAHAVEVIGKAVPNLMVAMNSEEMKKRDKPKFDLPEQMTYRPLKEHEGLQRLKEKLEKR